MVVIILVIGFILWILFASFAGEDTETKVFGLTFFLSFFLIGPLFGGILSIHAPIPMDSENTIDILSIVCSFVVAGAALGIYKIIDGLRWKAITKKREREREEKRKAGAGK